MSQSENADAPHDPSPDDDQSVFLGGNAQCTLAQLLECAKEFDRRTSPSGDAEKWFRAESESLLRWANECGCFLSEAQFRQLVGGFPELEGGHEHVVFYLKSGGRVLKVTRPPHFGCDWHLLGYVQNLVWNNEVFEDRFELVGVTQTEEGVSVVVSQPFVEGVSPPPDEIAEWFELQGCTRKGPWRWEYPNGTIATDAHTGNLIKLVDGHLVPIDVQLQVKTA